MIDNFIMFDIKKKQIFCVIVNMAHFNLFPYLYSAN